MGYATLAKLDPVIGLYTCFFASLFYMFFGTSHHVSIGVFQNKRIQWYKNK
jgi:MFS superfamily sulfate permease-like transporter